LNMKLKIFFTASALVGMLSCSKLDEKLNGEISGQEAQSLFGSGTTPNITPLLNAAYESLRTFQTQDVVWASQEHTTDEVIGPTRGGDWDDNGIWRVLHNHKWDADHNFLRNSWTDLGRVIFATTDILRFNPPTQQAAETRFLRAFAMFWLVDGWNSVPYRENTADPREIPKVRKGTEALDYIIAELNAALPGLPNYAAGQQFIASKDAARVLLMKCYLNKGVVANRQAPTFAAADMNQVITLADQIIQSGNYSLNANFFDNFARNNDVISMEDIFTGRNLGGTNSGNVRSRWFCTLHYNQNPSGWNGFTTLSDFYNKFDPSDARRGGNAYPGVTNVSGIRPGFLVGQQFDQNGVALKDRKGNPLSFTPAVKLKETGDNLEVTGIRVVKYPPDYTNGDNVDNDYVFFRYADVLLMKAEALLRGGTATAVAPTTALAAVNVVRARAGAAASGSVNLDQLLDERGREFYWEGWRRNDLVRFGKFLNAWQEKPASGPERLLFPIPNRALASNPNLAQNPGY
jgi:starch-binding outer membrane protein, SusD/RagB family